MTIMFRSRLCRQQEKGVHVRPKRMNQLHRCATVSSFENQLECIRYLNHKQFLVLCVSVVIKEEEDVRFDAPDLSMNAIDEQHSNDEEDGVADPDFVDPTNSDDDLNMAEMEQELVELNESEEESSDDDGLSRRKAKGKKGKSKGKKRGRKETIAEPIS